MSDQNGKLILPPDEIVFEYHDAEGNPQTGKIDVVESQLMQEELFDEHDKESVAVSAYQDWIQGKGFNVSFSQAWSLIIATQNAFQEFKKKLPTSVKSHIDMVSAQRSSTE